MPCNSEKDILESCIIELQQNLQSYHNDITSHQTQYELYKHFVKEARVFINAYRCCDEDNIAYCMSRLDYALKSLECSMRYYKLEF